MSIRSSIPAVILVTGASRGLGRGIALELAAQGCSVAINYASNAAAAAETVKRCQQAARGPRQQFVAIQADIGSTSARQHLLDETLARFGRLDGLVNNAGVAPKVRADLTETTEESLEEVMRTNLVGPFFLTQLVARHWLAQKPAPALPAGFKGGLNNLSC